MDRTSVETTCALCGRVFLAGREGMKACSPECQTALTREEVEARQKHIAAIEALRGAK
jgi:hypothetical protein